MANYRFNGEAMAKVGRPEGRNFTTLLIGVTKDEKVYFEQEFQKYKLENGLAKLSKSQFARTMLIKGINADKN